MNNRHQLSRIVKIGEIFTVWIKKVEKHIPKKRNDMCIDSDDKNEKIRASEYRQGLKGRDRKDEVNIRVSGFWLLSFMLYLTKFHIQSTLHTNELCIHGYNQSQIRSIWKNTAPVLNMHSLLCHYSLQYSKTIYLTFLLHQLL